MPPKFEWIKPGVKMANKDYPNHKATATNAPHWANNHACWLVAVDGGGYWQCDIAMPAEKAPITLTLTREQAQDIAEILADVLHYGPSKQLEVLKKQIEDKLK